MPEETWLELGATVKYCCNLLPMFDDLLPYHATTVLAWDQVPAWTLISVLYRGMVVLHIIFTLLLWVLVAFSLLRHSVLTRNYNQYRTRSDSLSVLKHESKNTLTAKGTEAHF